ncbi:hypothetical protein K1719_046836 [Acacia pycnantha]|nr:hypothetical protein K1719_046836 [Acacia pycnantha]
MEGSSGSRWLGFEVGLGEENTSREEEEILIEVAPSLSPPSFIGTVLYAFVFRLSLAKMLGDLKYLFGSSGRKCSPECLPLLFGLSTMSRSTTFQWSVMSMAFMNFST